MPGKVIHKTMDLGYPGNVSRSNDNIVINRRVGEGDVPFGAPVVLQEDNSIVAFGAEHDAADLAGIAARIVKQTADYYNPSGVYLEGEPADVLARGSITVEVKSGTPVAGGKVYIRIAENEAIPEGVVGGFEAEADGENTVELTNVKFTTGNMDANKVAEVTVLSRHA